MHALFGNSMYFQLYHEWSESMNNVKLKIMKFYLDCWCRGCKKVEEYNKEKLLPLEVPGTNFETKIVKFRWFLGPSDQNKLYDTPLLSKIWDLGDWFFWWRISFDTFMITFVGTMIESKFRKRKIGIIIRIGIKGHDSPEVLLLKPILIFSSQSMSDRCTARLRDLNLCPIFSP